MNRECIELQLLASKKFLEAKYGIIKLGYFGSFARNQQNETSDVDILVEFIKPIGFEFLEVKFFLEDLLGLKVDLATDDMLTPLIREQVLKEVVYIDECGDGVPVEFKQRVEGLVKKLQPDTKENNELLRAVTGICEDDFYGEFDIKNAMSPSKDQ